MFDDFARMPFAYSCAALPAEELPKVRASNSLNSEEKAGFNEAPSYVDRITMPSAMPLEKNP